MYKCPGGLGESVQHEHNVVSLYIVGSGVTVASFCCLLPCMLLLCVQSWHTRYAQERISNCAPNKYLSLYQEELRSLRFHVTSAGTYLSAFARTTDIFL